MRDLKLGYYHVDIFGFSWIFTEMFHILLFLFFCLASVLHAFFFTKLLCPPATCKKWHLMSQNRFFFFFHLNDGISGQHDYISAQTSSLVQCLDLHIASAGLIKNENKSCWEPVQKSYYFKPGYFEFAYV